MILDEILAHKRQEVAARRLARPIEALSALARPSAGPSDGSSGSRGSAHRFAQALRQPGMAVIAEFKRRSPSGGELRPDASAADVARQYAAHGAAALSVLTDERYFGGSDGDLIAAREASGLQVLRKDFVVDSYQLYEAQAVGADAVLLIVRALDQAALRGMLQLADELQMDALVEAHSADEVTRALDAGAHIIGVNNRDLDTLVTDVSLCLRLRSLVPPECVFVAESGISLPHQIEILLEASVDAVLIGEALVRAPDPGAKLRDLVAAGRPWSVTA